MDKIMKAMVGGYLFGIPNTYDLVYVMSVARESGIDSYCHTWCISVMTMDKQKREYFLNTETQKWTRIGK